MSVIEQRVALKSHSIQKALVWAFPILLFTGLTALGAQIRIPLPGTPVPVTLQTLFVLLSGAWLGSLRGGLSQALYVLLGVVGLPIFSGSAYGMEVLLGPTGGYLLGFILASISVGRWLQAERSFFFRAITLWLSGSLLIYGCGLLDLVYVHSLSWERALTVGFYPFLIGDVIKICLASSLLALKSSSK